MANPDLRSHHRGMDERTLKAARDAAALAWTSAGKPTEGPEREGLNKALEDLARYKREQTPAPDTGALARLSDFAKRGGKVVTAQTEKARALVEAERCLRRAFALPRLGKDFPSTPEEQDAAKVLMREYGSVRLALTKIMPAAAHVA